ncbi:MAG TPA: CHRD domain-containing protein [Solirubrobacteraceae bacterium]|nr:CHRD domain-containing protein [Solirubrobacteraceae bacterium]
MRSMLILAALAALVLAAPASAKVKRLETNLTAAQETMPTDPDARGSVKLRLDRAKKRVCFTIRVNDAVDDVVAAHIHKGAKGVDGDILVDLITTPEPGPKFTGCTKNVARSVIRAILRHPRRYYVNVHTMDFAGGEIRGQLHKP